MIQKLEPHLIQEISADGKVKGFTVKEKPTLEEMQNKINEIIDYLNNKEKINFMF